MVLKNLLLALDIVSLRLTVFKNLHLSTYLKNYIHFQRKATKTTLLFRRILRSPTIYRLLKGEGGELPQQIFYIKLFYG